MSFYTILGIHSNATLSEVCTAYKTKALRYHPDKSGDTAEFQRLVKIKNILTDARLRFFYDLYGEGEELEEAILYSEDIPLETPAIEQYENDSGTSSLAHSISEEVDHDDVYEVERIVDSGEILDVTYYKIKWVGYKKETWEPETNLCGCLDKLNEFRSKHGKRTKRLAGADNGLGDFNISNWLTIEQVIEHIQEWSNRMNIKTNIPVSEYKTLRNKDAIYILLHHCHLFTLLHLTKEKIIYLTDGNNCYMKNKRIKSEIDHKIPLRVIPLENNYQIEIDQCGSAAILAALEFKRWYSNRIGKPDLLNVSSYLRNRIRKMVHRERSTKIQGYKNNISKIQPAICPYCKKYFKYNKQKLAQHIRMSHKIKGYKPNIFIKRISYAALSQ